MRKLMSVKGIGIIVFALLAGLLLIMFSDGKKTNESTGIASANVDKFTFEAYEEALEERLEGLITRIDGVSSVSVMVVLDKGYEEELAGKDNGYLTLRDQSGNQTGLETARIAPKVRGAAVVCRGGEDAALKREIIALLSSLLDLPTSRIYVGSSE